MPPEDELEPDDTDEADLPPIAPPELVPSDFDKLQAASPQPEEEADFFWFWLDMAWQRTAINLTGFLQLFLFKIFTPD